MKFNCKNLRKLPHVDFYTVIFLCFLLHMMLLRFNFFFTERLWSDEGLYSWFGKRIFSDPSLIFSKEVTAHHPPLFAIFLAIGHIFLPSELACHLVPFIFYGVGIIAIYQLGTKIKNRFVGLLSAFVLAMNGYYFYYSSFVLIDVPLMVFFIILAVLLEDIDEKSPLKKHFLLGFWTAAALLLKSSAIVIIPWIFFYYFLSLKELSLYKRLKKSLIPFFFMSIIIFLLSIKNYYQLGAIRPQGPSIGFSHVKDFGASIYQFVRLIGFPNLWLLFLGGLFVMKGIERKKRILLLSWLIIVGGGVFLTSALVEIRFTLLVLPPMVVISALALEKLITVLEKKFSYLKYSLRTIIPIILLIGLSIPFGSVIRGLIESNKFFIGYYLAGEYISDIARPDSLILAGSERQIRYTSNINFKEFGGKIIAFRHSKEELEALIKKRPAHLILEIDQWEPLQPQWALPMTEETLTYLKKQGFNLVKVIGYNSNINEIEKRGKSFIYIFER